jgi:hypothetical protein
MPRSSAAGQFTGFQKANNSFCPQWAFFLFSEINLIIKKKHLVILDRIQTYPSSFQGQMRKAIPQKLEPPNGL